MNEEADMVSGCSRNVLPVHARQLVVNEINLNEIGPTPERFDNW
jgi:hypothetical protein